MSTSEKGRRSRPGIPRAVPLALSLALTAALGLCPAAVAGAPSRPDPSEEITVEELQTIPEPVPASPAAGKASTVRSPISASQSAPARAEPALPRSLWRVQVFVTQDRELADRTAREAAQLLHCRAYVDSEASHYKVRLGDFGSEVEAGALRAEALRAGYPGAFRIRCVANPTLNKD